MIFSGIVQIINSCFTQCFKQHSHLLSNSSKNSKTCQKLSILEKYQPIFQKKAPKLYRYSFNAMSFRWTKDKGSNLIFDRRCKHKALGEKLQFFVSLGTRKNLRILNQFAFVLIVLTKTFRKRFQSQFYCEQSKSDKCFEL